ncbi:hypothetical protein GCM10017586_27090 [Microbacterium imperiale]|uniref:Lipoprotein n=2 Tax=Microbacterium imperiale TaxID=33884 RepID=A0A9W6HJ02_9MICO|nr:hypothetical protein GCM10017544_30290 [Microbacterium imperiale]GLJ81026.1 hypothetical protein GCM10017586_27090 [Microbacterium imperiale]
MWSMRRWTLLAAAVTCVLAVTGCSAGGESVVATPVSSDTPTATPTQTAPTPKSTPTLGASLPSPGSGPGVEVDTRTLAEACVAASGQIYQDFESVLARVTIHWDDARSALRPDDAWYVVVPLSDPQGTTPTEFQCELTKDLSGALSSGIRAVPDPDDFELWATGREHRDGL